MIHITNLIRIFHNVKMSKGLIKILVVSVICVLLVSQTALAWSFWDWVSGKKQQPTTTMKPQVQSPQPKASPTIVSNCDKQAAEAAYYKKLSDDFQRQSKAWHKEFELAMNYAKGLERAASEKAKLYNLCNDYVYPQCPLNSVKLTLVCSGSMRPEFDCQYADIKGFNPNTYPYYEPKVCDVASFEVSTPINTRDVNGNSITLKRIIHRIISANNGRFTTKGDAVDVTDPYQPSKEEIKWIVCRD